MVISYDQKRTLGKIEPDYGRASPMVRSSHTTYGWYALPFLVILLNGCGSHESPIDRSLRKAALTYPRPVEGRLSVAGRFARWGESPITPRHDPASFSDSKDGRILRGSRPAPGKHEPEELHHIGLLSLYDGQAARAVSELEAVAERKPSSAVLSDLAAAYLALAEDDRPWLRVDAIAAATRAVEQAPDEPRAAFNLALALERMSLAHEARLAWGRYLKLEEDKEWRQEASERIARLSEPGTLDRWVAQKTSVAAAASAGDRATLERLARQIQRPLKEFLEGELLASWADAVGTKAAEDRLVTAKRVAETLANTGERLYVDAISLIERRPDLAGILAEGHKAYARGLAIRGDCSQAMPEFENALERLSEGRSPMAKAARYQQLVCTYRSRPSEAESALAELASELERLPYPTLLANTEAMLGLCAIADGRHSQAVAHYERSVRLLTRIGDTDVRRSYGMLDEAYRFLGDRENAWRYRMEALRSAVAAGDRQIRHGVLVGLAQDLVGAGRLEAARAVLDEMLANANAWAEPVATAETLLRRIEFGLASGAKEQTAADITACARVLENFRQPGDRERLKTELMVASAEHQLGTNPVGASKAIHTAMPLLDASGDGLLLPRALLDLARAQVSLSDTAAAEDAFSRALQIYEARREGTEGERLRISFFSTVQVSFDAMIRFQALERGDAHAAFTYSERVRARALRDRAAVGGAATELLPLDEQLDRIPPNVAVLAYTVLPESLLVWHLRRDSLKMHVLPIVRSKVAELVDSLRSALTDPASRDNGQIAGAKAFDALVRPMQADLPAEAELVFIPDRELYQVPFSALFDRLRGHYLIEDHACLVSPSLEFYLTSLEGRTLDGLKPRRVLAVGDPAFDNERFSTLPRLPHAREEALSVGALYKDRIILVDEDATRLRILDGLQGSDVLHLAAHVVVDARDPLASFVASADTDRVPLRVSDFHREQLRSVELVFLSACDTAPGFADGDREGVAGLARAFLGAGVPSVIATLWAVDDQAAAQLAVTFHARLLAGETPAQALRLAQLALLSNASAAPFAWAPFQLFQGP